MDIEAPIIPGRSAAGIQLGLPIEEILKKLPTAIISEEVRNPFFPHTPVIISNPFR